MNKRTKACDISPAVKRTVWERDGECCIFCGNPQAMPNAHYIRRSQGGLGIEENIITLCRKCHDEFDNGGAGVEYGRIIEDYLKGQYPDWHREKLYYKKG